MFFLSSRQADLERKKRVAFEEDRKAVLSYGSGSHLSPSIRNSHLRNRSSIDSVSFSSLLSFNSLYVRHYSPLGIGGAVGGG